MAIVNDLNISEARSQTKMISTEDLIKEIIISSCLCECLVDNKNKIGGAK